MKVWQAKALYASTIIGVSLVAACGGGGGSSCESPEAALAAVNVVRAQPAWCGPAVGPVVLNPVLQALAQGHADDLARTRTPAQHDSPDGRTFGDRLRASGYPGRAGENAASGTDGAMETAQAFADSRTGHCPNIMAERHTEAGLACATDGRAAYWVQVMGSRP
jgi:uncharacterized protein YkwD